MLSGGESLIFWFALIFFVSITMFAVGVLIFFGIESFIQKITSVPKAKDEEWFITEAGNIYSLALDWHKPNGMTQRQLEERLKEKIIRYNKESLKVSKWNFRCPKSLSFEYLGIVKNTAEAGGDNK